MATKKSGKRVLIYVRLSSWQGEADPSVSPQNQEASCRAFCEAKGWEVVEVVRDLDVSGSDKGLRLDRPGLIRIREEFGNIDVVIFAKLDRLARNVVDFRTFADECQENGVALVSVAESLDMTTAMGKFVSTILAAFAEMEAATISDRIRTAIPTILRSGRVRGGRLPGWLTSIPNPKGAGRVAALDPKKTKIAREIVDRVLEGEPYQRIAKDLMKRGIPTFQNKGGKWTANTIRELTLRPALAGYTVHRGQILADDKGFPLKGLPAVVTAKEFAQLKKEAERRGSAVDRRAWEYSDDGWLLDGVLFCSDCGGRLAHQSRTDKTGKKYDYYACRKPGASCVAIGRKGVEALVSEKFLTEFGRFEVLEEIDVSTVEVDERINALEEAIELTRAKMNDRTEDPVALGTILAALYSEQREIESRGLVLKPATERVHTGQSFRAAWEETSDVAFRRGLIRQPYERIDVSRPKKATGPHVDPKRLRFRIRHDEFEIEAPKKKRRGRSHDATRL